MVRLNVGMIGDAGPSRVEQERNGSLWELHQLKIEE